MLLLTRQQRCARLCCFCLRNIAYFRAWWDAGVPHGNIDYVVRANINFLDAAVLEWCKLFTSPKREKYHFKHVVDDHDAFLAAMLSHIGITRGQWDDYVEPTKRYRDKYVAHWDEDTEGASRPVLEIALNSAAYLVEHLTEHGENGWWPYPSNAMRFYDQRREHALASF